MGIFAPSVRVAICAAMTASLAFSTTPALAQEPPAAVAAGQGMVAANVDQLVDSNVTLGAGEANWDWVRSFREYVGMHQETITGGITRSEHQRSLLWPTVEGQQVDLNNLQSIKFGGSVNWNHHGGILNVTLANPTVDFVNKRLLIDGMTQYL